MFNFSKRTKTVNLIRNSIVDKIFSNAIVKDTQK